MLASCWTTSRSTILPPERRPIGIAFQDGVLFPHLSVLENVAFPVRARGARTRAARTYGLELLDRLAPAIDARREAGDALRR